MNNVMIYVMTIKYTWSFSCRVRDSYTASEMQQNILHKFSKYPNCTKIEKKKKEIKHLDGFPCVYTNDEDPEEFIMVMTLSQMVAQMSRNEKSWSHKA